MSDFSVHEKCDLTCNVCSGLPEQLQRLRRSPRTILSKEEHVVAWQRRAQPLGGVPDLLDQQRPFLGGQRGELVRLRENETFAKLLGGRRPTWSGP